MNRIVGWLRATLPNSRRQAAEERAHPRLPKGPDLELVAELDAIIANLRLLLREMEDIEAAEARRARLLEEIEKGDEAMTESSLEQRGLRLVSGGRRGLCDVFDADGKRVGFIELYEDALGAGGLAEEFLRRVDTERETQ